MASSTRSCARCRRPSSSARGRAGGVASFDLHLDLDQPHGRRHCTLRVEGRPGHRPPEPAPGRDPDRRDDRRTDADQHDHRVDRRRRSRRCAGRRSRRPAPPRRARSCRSRRGSIPGRRMPASAAPTPLPTSLPRTATTSSADGQREDRADHPQIRGQADGHEEDRHEQYASPARIMPSRTCGATDERASARPATYAPVIPASPPKAWIAQAAARTMPTVAARPPPRPCRWAIPRPRWSGSQRRTAQTTTIVPMIGRIGQGEVSARRRLGHDQPEDDETEDVIDDRRPDDGHRRARVHEVAVPGASPP